MKLTASLYFALALCGGILAQQPPKNPGTTPKPEPKGVEVTLDGMKSTTPAAWQAEKPANLLRSYQFRIPHAEGDKYDAEVYILKSFTGSIDDNLARLKDMFVLPPDMPKDKAVVQSNMKLGKATLTMLDIQGTFLLKHLPIDQGAKETRPDYRMVAALWQSPDEALSIRLIGPKKTVDWRAKEFNEWLKNFK
jgi:hypothetical protein